jgi:hypothetical protein
MSLLKLRVAVLPLRCWLIGTINCTKPHGPGAEAVGELLGCRNPHTVYTRYAVRHF